MSERRFGQSLTGREHVYSDLRDAGVTSESKWKEAFEFASNDRDFDSDGLFPRDYSTLVEISKSEDETANNVMLSGLNEIERFSLNNHDIIDNILNKVESTVSRQVEYSDEVKRKQRSVFLKLFEKCSHSVLDIELIKAARHFGERLCLSDDFMERVARRIFIREFKYTFESYEIMHALKQTFGVSLDDVDTDQIIRLFRAYNIGKEGKLKHGNYLLEDFSVPPTNDGGYQIDELKSLRQDFPDLFTLLVSMPGVKERAEVAFVERLSDSVYWKEIKEIFGLDNVFVSPLVENKALEYLAQGEFKRMMSLIDIFEIPPAHFQGNVRAYEAARVGMETAFTKGRVSIATQIKDKLGVEDNLLSDEESSRQLFRRVRNEKAWSDEQNISGPFGAGAERFGYKKMFEYLNREELTLHDGLHNFRRILAVADASGLSPEQFYAQILNQVKNDSAQYDEGTAHHKLNSLVNNIRLDFQVVIEDLKKYEGIEKLRELAETFSDTSAVFSSWKFLKKYEELCSLLGQREILDDLAELRSQGKERLAAYVETLAFHPNISMPEVTEFWREPARFLGSKDEHTPEHVQDRKKPSNYFNIPHLDLSAEQLRDALVEGAYDRIQSFPPFEVVYAVDASRAGEKYLSLSELIVNALGKRDSSIQGEAKNVGMLFSRINAVFKAKGINIRDFIGSTQPEKDFASVYTEIESEIRPLLFDPFIGISSKTEEYRLKVSKKSDPEAVVAGNDTACCMPFGSGKNNVYMFNPACSVLLMQRKNADGVWRTVAQSVLTPDKDIKKNIAELKNAFEAEEKHMSEVVDQDILSEGSSILTCDNIEVAENFKGNDVVIEALYKDFLRRYISRCPEGEFERGRVIVGQGYADALETLPKVPNTFFPETPVGYSDNLHADAYKLDIDRRSGGENMIINALEAASQSQTNQDDAEKVFLPRGVNPLTFRQSLEVAYLEGKAYQSNQSLIQNLHNMENALIAKDVNNAAKERPNMSFRYTGTDGRMHGYLLAYQGGGENTPYIYISDLASDGNLKAGGSLMKAFAESYKRNYTEKNNTLPLYAEFRDQTSYRIITKQIDKLSEDAGVKFVIEEIGNYNHGGDVMHQLFIYPETLSETEKARYQDIFSSDRGDDYGYDDYDA